MKYVLNSPAGSEYGPMTAGSGTADSGGGVIRPSSSWAWMAVWSALLYAGYFVLRYAGLWTENDTSVFTSVAQETLRAGNVLFPGQYVHGFAYPSWLSSLSLLTGLSPMVLNAAVVPFVGALLLSMVCYVTYRTLLGSDRFALAGVLILYAVPELMFSVLRGNHEKLNIAFLLMTVFVLFKGVDAMRRGIVQEIAVWSVLYYVLVFANSATNDYFGSTFVVASFLTLLLLYAYTRWRSADEHLRTATVRYGATILTSWLVVWWVMLFVFPPAGSDFSLLKTASQKLSHLFLTLNPASNPYSSIASAWASPFVSNLMSVFRVVLLIASVIVFFVKVRLIALRRITPSTPTVFLLCLYTAYAFLVGIAIPLDFVGLSAGSNLEVRNFTYFSLIAAPVASLGLMDVLGRRRAGGKGQTPERGALEMGWFRRHPRLGSVGVAVTVVLIALGMFKTTLDPIFSNQWIFYSPGEKQALAAFHQLDTATAMWSGPDNRLVYVFGELFPGNARNNQVTGYNLRSAPQNTDALWSPQVVANTIAQGAVVPDFTTMNRVYDNGGADIYRTAPKTIFQN
ncbi:MAG: hypothetical protein ACYCVB_03950 [Bacilli bacterium]